jgi:hypothetical protein
MNKYLTKIAEDLVDPDDKKVLAGTAVLGGAGVIQHNYSRGNLTGRSTYFHGSSDANTAKIKMEGLTPNRTTGVSHIAGLTEHNKDLVFAEKSKYRAMMYGENQNKIESGTHIKQTLGMVGDANKPELPVLKRMLTGNNKSVTKINVPDWKEGLRGVDNPEYTNYKNATKFNFGDRMQDEAMKHTFQDSVYTAKGGIHTDHIVGSPTYKKNSAKEILEYASKNRSRFGKGVGMAALGAAGIAGGAAYLKHSFKGGK